jgi:hypothetical protein
VSTWPSSKYKTPDTPEFPLPKKVRPFCSFPASFSRVFFPRLLSRLLPHGVSDLKPGGRAGPPDETTVFLNMLPVVIPCIFLVAILIVVIALRYFNAIAEQTPEGERMFCLVVCCACVVSSRTLFASRISPLNALQRHISMQT